MTRHIKPIVVALCCIAVSFSYSVFSFATSASILNCILWLIFVLFCHLIALPFLCHMHTSHSYGLNSRSLTIAPFALFLVSLVVLFFVRSAGFSVQDCILVVLVFPITEEVIFRGIIWDLLKGCLTFNTMCLVVATSVLFSVQHIQYGDFDITEQTAFQLFYTFIAGVILGIFRMKADNLFVPIFLHSTGNALLKIFFFAFAG